MISLLIYVLIVLIIFGAVVYCIRLLPLEEPFKTIAIVVVILIFVLILLGLIGVIPGVPLRPLAGLVLPGIGNG